MIQLALVALLLGQGGYRRSGNTTEDHGRIREYLLPVAGSSYAFFEFAPSSGAGMPAACSGTTPSGAKGEVLTFTRNSTRYCTKGNETSGIANGHLVLLTTNQTA